MNVLKSIYNILSNDVDVSAVVSTRVYPVTTPQKVANPHITFDLYNTDPTDTKDGASKLDVYYIEVSCFHKEALDCVTLANHCRGALDRFSGINSGNVIDKIIFEGQDGPYFDHERELFRVDLDVRVRVRVDFGTNSSGSYLFTYIINVNGVLNQTGTFNPLDSNTFNISA